MANESIWDDETIYTVTELAFMIEKSRDYIRLCISLGQIVPAGRLGMESYFTEKEVKRFLQERYGSK